MNPDIKSQHRRTPCIGICSTTYGDLVCRGCKRFAHEIVQWNGYAADQQQVVWTRLSELRVSTIDRLLILVDEELLYKVAEHYAIDRSRWQLLAWDLLLLRGEALSPESLGLELLKSGEVDLSPSQLADKLDKELFAASQAYYERSYRTLAQ